MATSSRPRTDQVNSPAMEETQTHKCEFEAVVRETMVVPLQLQPTRMVKKTWRSTKK